MVMRMRPSTTGNADTASWGGAETRAGRRRARGDVALLGAVTQDSAMRFAIAYYIIACQSYSPHESRPEGHSHADAPKVPSILRPVLHWRRVPRRDGGAR